MSTPSLTELVDQATPASLYGSTPKADASHAAAHFAAARGSEWAYREAEDTFYHWTGTHFAPEAGRLSVRLAEALKAALHAVGLSASQSRINDARLFARAQVRLLIEVEPGLINFRNGTYDTATNALRHHNPNDGLTWCLPYDFVEGDAPTINHFLAQTISDSVGRRAYMAHVGQALRADRRLHKALLLIGPPRSGKSTALMLANAVCGNDPASNAGAQLFSQETEGLRARAQWGSQRIVTIEELPAEALRSEEIFKAMTSHAGVPMRRMHVLETKANRWTPKLLMASNEAPRYSDRSGALTQRLIIVRCPNARGESDQDSRLFDRLLPELGAFATACLRQAAAVLDAGRYEQSSNMLADLAAIENEGDAVKSFVIEHCVVEKDAVVPSDTIYQAYKDYCEENGHTRPMAKETMSRAIIARYPDVRAAGPRRIGGRLGRVLENIRLRTDRDPVASDESVTGVTATLQQDRFAVTDDVEHPNAINRPSCNGVTAKTGISHIDSPKEKYRVNGENAVTPLQAVVLPALECPISGVTDPFTPAVTHAAGAADEEPWIPGSYASAFHAMNDAIKRDDRALAFTLVSKQPDYDWTDEERDFAMKEATAL